MTDETLAEYLASFHRMAVEAGLSPRKPGMNWVSFPALANGSHISLSVGQSQIQINLNNETDKDRLVFEALQAAKEDIENEIGMDLSWEAKPGVKKSAIRATLERGYRDLSHWSEQHQWAIDMIKRFETTFSKRLR
jgi:hypothetical protein